MGSGTGLLSLALAERAARVWAIDSSPAMCDYLRVKAASADLQNVETVRASAVSLPLVDGIADLVVSNYCLHELRRADKHRFLAEARRVLKPGGRLVIGDMMFSLNPTQTRDRRVVIVMLRKIAQRGLPGIWRLLKNAVRLLAGRWEHPANAAWWHEALTKSGFQQVRIEMLAHEGGIAIGETPAHSTDLPAGSPNLLTRSALPTCSPDQPARPTGPTSPPDRPAHPASSPVTLTRPADPR